MCCIMTKKNMQKIFLKFYSLLKFMRVVGMSNSALQCDMLYFFLNYFEQSFFLNHVHFYSSFYDLILTERLHVIFELLKMYFSHCISQNYLCVNSKIYFF